MIKNVRLYKILFILGTFLTQPANVDTAQLEMGSAGFMLVIVLLNNR